MDYKEKLKEALNSKATPFEVLSWIEEQFPEIKESEDERIRKWCISHFRECFRVTKDNAEYQEYLNNKVIPWLEKRDKQILANSAKTCKDGQAPAWSEEDYNEIETIACHLDNTDNEGMAEVLRNIRDKYYDIIPQNTWKPSKEQMKQLKNAADIFPDSRLCCGLKTLYEDLKKLREE